MCHQKQVPELHGPLGLTFGPLPSHIGHASTASCYLGNQTFPSFQIAGRNPETAQTAETPEFTGTVWKSIRRRHLSHLLADVTLSSVHFTAVYISCYWHSVEPQLPGCLYPKWEAPLHYGPFRRQNGSLSSIGPITVIDFFLFLISYEKSMMLRVRGDT